MNLIKGLRGMAWRFLRGGPRVQARGFDAAKVSRLTQDWLVTDQSADEVLRRDLRSLISRSRQLEENNEYAGGFLHQVERNVLRDRGVLLQMKVMDRKPRKKPVSDVAANNVIEAGWARWGQASSCCLTKDLTWRETQRLLLRAAARDGAPLIRLIRGAAAENEFNFALQLLEVDHLDPLLNRTLNDGSQVRMGVEQNKFRQVTAYHLLANHPGDSAGFYRVGGQRYERVPAEEILHPFMKSRIGQSRGYPWLACSMLGLKILSGYKEAELVAARTSAAKMGWFEEKDGSGQPTYTGEKVEGKDGGGKYMDAEPGSMEFAPTGHTFKSWDPQHPVQAFGDFVRECLRGVAQGAGVSYTSFANDLSSTSYSSGRIGLLNERDGWKVIQQWFVDQVCQPVFEAWLEMALLSGAVELPAAKFGKFNAASWAPPRWQWVDPLKEVKGWNEAIANGLTSRKRVLAEQGLDEEEVYREIAEGDALAQSLGLQFANPAEKDGGSVTFGG